MTTTTITSAKRSSQFLTLFDEPVTLLVRYDRRRVESDDYVFGAMALYNDIINLFVYILRLYAESERRNKD